MCSCHIPNTLNVFRRILLVLNLGFAQFGASDSISNALRFFKSSHNPSTVSRNTRSVSPLFTSNGRIWYTRSLITSPRCMAFSIPKPKSTVNFNPGSPDSPLIPSLSLNNSTRNPSNPPFFLAKRYPPSYIPNRHPPHAPPAYNPCLP